MKILHISTQSSSGGATRAMLRLHFGLKEKGVDSSIFSLTGKAISDEFYLYKNKRDIKTRIRNVLLSRLNKKEIELLNSANRKHEKFSTNESPYKAEFIRQLPDADLYHLHWVTDFVDIPTFFEQVKKPVVWTFHDMNPFTGGCHYDEGCGKYANGCGACPQLASDQKDDLSKKIFEQKVQAVQQIPDHKLIIAGNSRWTTEEARKSRIFEGKKIKTVHLGVNHNLFKPRDTAAIRPLFGIPEDATVLLFGAPNVANRRKGFSELKEAVEKLRTKTPELVLISFGEGDASFDTDIHHIQLGRIENNLFLSMVYNAADLFVIPSLQETFGQTCLEAMACGVPCAGFDTGGIPDMINPGETGYLAETGNPVSLAEAIVNTLGKKEELGKNARKMVEASFTLGHQAEAYVKVYNELLSSC